MRRRLSAFRALGLVVGSSAVAVAFADAGMGCGDGEASRPTTEDAGRSNDATITENSDAAPSADSNAPTTGGDASDASDADAVDGSSDGGNGAANVSTYEAESGNLGGGATVVGNADGSTRTVGDPAGEASGRQAVTLPAAHGSVSWTSREEDVGARGLVVRFSLPDATGGGGRAGTLGVSITNASGAVTTTATLNLTSRYAWVYGGTQDGTKRYNTTANAATYATATTPIHIYDETQVLLPTPLAMGDVVTLTNTTSDAAIAIDFAELETMTAPGTQPAGFLSVTDSRCGAVLFDVRQSGRVFDGADDSSYGSDFHAIIGHNPVNPVSFQVAEKDYYATAPGTDALQDTTTNAAIGVSMFDLADHNTAAFETCLGLAGADAGAYAGVWIPPGRFYMRGVLHLPNGASLVGAGSWYTKLAAVDSAAPVTSGDAGAIPDVSATSGNLVITGQGSAGSVDGATISGFAMFGNVTQRDTIDVRNPSAIFAALSTSDVSDVWVEHYFTGLKTNGAATGVHFTASRVRNVFADGIDFYGSTTDSTMDHCTVRSAGDDGFALWAQGDDGDAGAVSHGNAIINCTSSLSWWGNGFSLYGGVGDSIADSSAADVLNYPGLQISTQFVPATIAAADSMSASATNVLLTRCGGDGYAQGFGGLLVGAGAEPLHGIVLQGIAVRDPANSGIDLRPVSEARGSAPALDGVSLTDVEVVGVSPCAAIRSGTNGSASLNDVCACDGGASPGTCSLANDAGASFTVTADTCTRTSCAP